MIHYIIDRGVTIANMRDRFHVVVGTDSGVSASLSTAAKIVGMTPDSAEAFRLLDQFRKDAGKSGQNTSD